MSISKLWVIFAGALLVSPLYAQGGPSSQEIEMAARSPEFRKVADQFVATAASGDVGKLERMLSPAAAARAGKEGMQKFLNGQVIPFFADYKELGKSVTVTNTTDASGNKGFAYYMYSVPISGQQKPFVIYVVEEAGQKTIANVLVNRYFEGRHK
ncbi:MAG TPA: hypothetical protein VJQ55_03485 [Candidatus Binatia bacterium]|nr:hypothetical protein [Candidatus Binatia bacterium]